MRREAVASDNSYRLSTLVVARGDPAVRHATFRLEIRPFESHTARRKVTYSIIGRDSTTGDIGVLLASFYYGCAPRTLLATAGVGIVVMQMVPEMRYGTLGIARMSDGEHPSTILTELTSTDDSRGIRQVAMMCVDGSVSAYTGAGCIPYSGHLIGNNCCAQGAMVARENVWTEVARSFESSTGALPDRLISAMRAGDLAGGDIRGRRAAAMLVVSGAPQESWVRARPIDIRIDDHPDPLAEVERHLAIQRQMVAIELAFERGLGGDIAGAVGDYARIAQHAPEDPDVTMRYAIMLALSGRIEDAREQLQTMASVHSGWAEVPDRLIAAGLLLDDSRLRNIVV